MTTLGFVKIIILVVNIYKPVGFHIKISMCHSNYCNCIELSEAKLWL